MDDHKKDALRARFERLVRITPGCWFLSVRKDPYPVMRVNGKQWCASRVAYELYVGPTEGVVQRGVRAICHRCDNPLCVNPDHLFIGTYFENMQDMLRKGRANIQRGSARAGAKLDDEKVRRILADTRSQRVIAREYGVDPSIISEVRTRKIWRHVNV